MQLNIVKHSAERKCRLGHLYNLQRKPEISWVLFQVGLRFLAWRLSTPEDANITLNVSYALTFLSTVSSRRLPGGQALTIRPALARWGPQIFLDSPSCLHLRWIILWGISSAHFSLSLPEPRPQKGHRRCLNRRAAGSYDCFSDCLILPLCVYAP